MGLIASKIQDIVVKYPKFDFSSTTKEMKTSLKEQIILICVSVLTLFLLDTSKYQFDYKTEVGNVIMTTVLIYSINILWDTGKAVFVIIDELQKMNNK